MEQPNNVSTKPAPRADASSITEKFVDGANPLDFVKKNLARHAQQAQAASPIAAQAAPVASPTKPDSMPDHVHEAIKNDGSIDAVNTAVNTPVKKEEASSEINVDSLISSVLEGKDEKSSEEPLEEPEVQDPDAIKAASKEQSISHFRKALNLEKEEKKKLEARAQELEQEVEKFRKGEVHPEKLQELEGEVQRLSKYEKVVALKTSAPYVNKITKPLEDIKQKALAIAADYAIPEHVLMQAFDETNNATLNRFLSDTFDDVGALEVKQLITQARGIFNEAIEMEKEPANAMEQLTQEVKLQREARKIETRKALNTKAQTSWVQALESIKKEGKAIEVIPSDDQEHNEKYVKPILHQAATEYGKMLTMLADNGLEDLSPELSAALAKMTILAHTSAIAIETREAAIGEARAVMGKAQQRRKFLRPNSTETIQTSSDSAPKYNRDSALDGIINKVSRR